MSSFHGVLAEGGYLLLGHSETLWQVSSAFSLVPVGEAFVYRKAHDSQRGAPPQRGASVPASTPRASRPVPLPAPVAQAITPGSRRRQPGKVAYPAGTALLATARAALAAGDYRSAAVGAEAALRSDPLLSPAYVLLGLARTTLGLDGTAVDPLRKAVYLDPTAGDAHFLLAGALSRLGQHAAAAVSYRAAAASLHRVDAGTRAELLGGRELEEMVELCTQLAENSAALARGDEPVSVPGGAT
jgi:chemotaxis protein methyltransferase CheR